jgi:Bacterial TSP3 repeat
MRRSTLRYVSIGAMSALVCVASHAVAQTYRVSGRVIDGANSIGITNVEIQLYYVSLNSTTNDLTSFASTNTDMNGDYTFDGLPGELEGHVRILELPTAYLSPMKETIRLSKLNPALEIIFRASPSATLTGSIAIVNGTADFTKFTIEASDFETNAATDSSFFIAELPAYQQTARLIYQDGYYFDERVISLPSMTPAHTNGMQILWHQPMHDLTTSGVLCDVNGNVLADARIRFLGMTTGVFVGMKTDANGNYAIYDLPADCYAVRAFVGRWGIEQRSLSATDSILCVGNGGSDTDGDGMPDGWELQYGLNPNDPNDAALDADSDGVSNLDEYRRGTNPNDSSSKNVTLYANSSTGSNGYDGLTLTVMGSHGPKLNIQAAIAAAFSGDSVEIASGEYVETTFDPQTKTVTLKPQGSVTIP